MYLSDVFHAAPERFQARVFRRGFIPYKFQPRNTLFELDWDVPKDIYPVMHRRGNHKHGRRHRFNCQRGIQIQEARFLGEQCDQLTIVLSNYNDLQGALLVIY